MALEGGRGQKRRRTVTTCTECARRKQRCNRETPCQHCLQRGVPDKCTYNAEVGTPPELERGTKRGRSPIVHDQLNDGVRDETDIDFPEQAGYLLTRDGSSLAHLRESLRDGDAQGPNEKTRQAVSYPSSLRQQYHGIIKRLPSEPLCDKLVDLFFSEANWHFQVLDRWFFDEQYKHWRHGLRSPSHHFENQGPHKLETLYFPALVFAVLSVATQFLPPDSEAAGMLAQSYGSEMSSVEISEDFSRSGAEIMAVLGRSNATCAGCEHDIIRSMWLKNQGQGYMSWQLLGAGIRQGQELGFHDKAKFRRVGGENIQQTALRAWRDQRERRVWVTLFVWDAHVSMTLNRPRLLNISDCTTDPPIDCDIPDDPTNSFPGLIEADQVPSGYTARLFSFHLSQKIHEMYNNGVHKSGIRDYEKVKNMHQSVIQMVHDLPMHLNWLDTGAMRDSCHPVLGLQRYHIQVLTNSFLTTLHRDHAPLHIESRQHAIQAAFDGLEAQEYIFWAIKPHQRRIFTLSCYTVDACLILASIALNRAAPVDVALLRRADEGIGRAIDRLSIMKDGSPLAKTGARLLTRCQKRVHERIPEGSNSSSSGPSSTELTPANMNSSTTSGNNAVVTPQSSNMDSLRDDLINFQNGMLEFDDRFATDNSSSCGGGGYETGHGTNGAAAVGGGVSSSAAPMPPHMAAATTTTNMGGPDFRALDFSLGLPLANNTYSNELFSYMMGQSSVFDMHYKDPPM